MIERIGGPSRFWRCPHCKTVLQKGMPHAFNIISPTTDVVGTATCGSCGHGYQQTDVYGGKYDLPEVKLRCPGCGTSLQGPAEELLGRSCPACQKTLPLA